MKNQEQHASPEIPEPDYDDPKELYAFFGLASYNVQLLEQGITNLLVGLRITRRETPTWDEVSKLYDTADRKTLGQMLSSVRQLSPFDPKLENRIDEALKKRNYLMHCFFVEHAEDLLSEPGKRKMIDELRKTIVSLKRVDSEVDDLWLSIWRKYGFTKERIQMELDAVRSALEKR